MFEQEAALLRFNTEYARQLLDGFPEARLWEPPSKGIHPAGWIVGHLATTLDMALGYFQLPGRAPATWRVLFGPGSSDDVPVDRRPSFAELRSVMDGAIGDLNRNLTSANPAKMAERHALPFPILQQTLPTNGDLLAHLVATHFAAHLGQLSVCRRVWGEAKLF